MATDTVTGEELKEQAVAAIVRWLETEIAAGKHPAVLMAEIQQALQAAFE